MASEASGTDFIARVFKFCGHIIKNSILKTMKYIITKQTLP
jgi:hypothetical protein